MYILLLCIKIIISCLLIIIPCYCTEHAVEIIGAGSSGIAAATRLLENNFTDFLVLEAEDIIGGRIISALFGDAVVDLGAEWCQGEDRNVLYERAKDLNIFKETRNELVKFYSQTFVDKNVSKTLNDLFRDIYFGDIEENKRNLSLTDNFFQREKWLSKQLFQGTFSYYSIKMVQNRSLRKDLAEPVYNFDNSFKIPLLSFAGEATSSNRYATVHGATGFQRSR